MAINRQDEYAFQMFGFSCNDFLEMVASVIEQEVEQEISGFTDELLDLETSEDGRKAIIKAGEGFKMKLSEAIKEPLEALSKQVVSFFNVPPYVLLPEDEVQRERVTQETEESLQRDIRMLKSKYRRAQFLKAVLQEELAQAKQIESQLKLFDEVTSQKQALHTFEKDVDKAQKKLHRLIQDILGLEVKDVSLQLSNSPSCAMSEEMLEHVIIDSYWQSK